MADYGLDIAIPFTGDPDPSLPWADDDDALLVPGSLALFDATHSASPLSGIPAVGATIPNIAWKRARDLIGSALFTGRIDNGTVGNAGTVLTVTALAAGTIQVGQTIAGTSVTSTYITGQVSGTPGGVGVYSVATSQSAASTVITAAAGDATSLALTRGGQADQAGVQITERTGMGGLHSIQTQTNGVVNIATTIDGKTALQNYVSANRSHAFYLSIWDRVTRVATTSADPGEAEIGYNTNAFNMVIQPNAFVPISSTGLLLGAMSDPASRNSAGNRFSAVASAGYSGTFSNLSRVTLSGWGMWGAWASISTYLNRSASRVLYRAYLEDLTASGRTYAQVQALDYALWQAAFAAGGRYAGDTFTAPAI